jgi:hypothetical protein
VAEPAAGVAASLREELGVTDGPLVKGGAVVFAFRKPYDYSEIWQVVLSSERPRGLTGHAGVAGDVVYAAFVAPADDAPAAETRLLLAEQLTGAALAGRGLPAWFCRSVGRAVAMRTEPRAQPVQRWKRDAAEAIGELGSAEDFFSGHADPAATAAAGGGFMATLLGGGKLPQFIRAFDGGLPFEEAFARAFRVEPVAAFTAWAARNAGR